MLVESRAAAVSEITSKFFVVGNAVTTRNPPKLVVEGLVVDVLLIAAVSTKIDMVYDGVFFFLLFVFSCGSIWTYKRPEESVLKNDWVK